jgi:hypothetical protein
MIISDQQRAENFQEYLLLLQDPNYFDVTFDDQSGGVSAIHIKHRFDNKTGVYGIKKGDYEKRALENLRKRGHVIRLESELAPNGVKTPDGTINGAIMDIKAVEGMGKWSIKDKFHDATKQCVECVVLYFHDKSLFSMERIVDGWNKFVDDIDSQRYNKTINRVICAIENEVIEWIPPK